MKRKVILIASILAGCGALSLAAGTTFAAVVTWPTETFQINDNSSSSYNMHVRDLTDLFDPESQPSENEYYISCPRHLRNLQKITDLGLSAGKTFKLMTSFDWDYEAHKNDDNAADYALTPIGNSAHPFEGIFDGQGYSIAHLYVRSTQQHSGMFGYITASANGTVAVQNLLLISPTVDVCPTAAVSGNIGFLCGYLNKGAIHHNLIYGGSSSYSAGNAILKGNSNATLTSNCGDFSVYVGGRYSGSMSVTQNTFVLNPADYHFSSGWKDSTNTAIIYASGGTSTQFTGASNFKRAYVGSTSTSNLAIPGLASSGTYS